MSEKDLGNGATLTLNLGCMGNGRGISERRMKMVEWKDKQIGNGEYAIVAKRFRLGYGWNLTRSRDDESAKDANYVGSISFEIRMSPQKDADAMKQALVRTLRRYLEAALEELGEETTTAAKDASGNAE